MFQETENWRDDGIVVEIGWSWLQAEQEGKGRKLLWKKDCGSPETPKHKHQMGTELYWNSILFSLDVLATHARGDEGKP